MEVSGTVQPEDGSVFYKKRGEHVHDNATSGQVDVQETVAGEEAGTYRSLERDNR